MSKQQQLKESLSALMDEELSELEARRILRDLDDDTAQAYDHWQLARDVMHGHAVQAAPEGFVSNLCANLGAQDSAADGGAGHSKSSWLVNAGRVAVAASVALVTVFGWQSMNDAGQDSPIVAHGEAPMARVLVNPELVSQSFVPEAAVRAKVVELDVEALSPLMMRHSDFAARHGVPLLSPYARVVTLESETQSADQLETNK